MGRLRLAMLASTAALALVAATPLASTAAPAAPAKAAGKYFALEGSGSHLLFGAKKTSKTFTEADARGGARQYVLNAKGQRTAVPADYDAYLVGDEPLFRKETKAVDGLTDVHWIRPERGTSGTWTVPEGSEVVAPAPGGWIIQTPTEQGDYGRVSTLRRVLTDGTTTDLGTPSPEGKRYYVEAAPSGLLFADETDGGDYASLGTLQFMPWSKPGSYTQVYPATGTAAQVGISIECGTGSSTLVRCIVGADNDDPHTLLIPLDGSKSQPSLEKCSPYLNAAVRTFGIAWTDRTTANGCKAGRVEQRTTAGKLTVSTRRYYRLQDPVSAFGRLVVATSTQRHLVTISSPTSTPKQIVGN